MNIKSTERNLVHYIEPNYIESNTYGDFEKAPDVEDYSIAVNLSVEVSDRVGGSSFEAENKKYVMSWDGKNGSVSFMQGSKLYFEGNKKGDYVNALTAKDAEFYYADLESNQGEMATNELFGIQSIHIDYDNFYVPQVTIQFVDIRGISLFMPEELRHKNSDGNVDGLASDDVAGSFFKSFFTMPYPKFNLMVKGFYGKPVTYELSVVDWKANFDCNTGNFGCTVNFIGYSYALLTDVTLNTLIAAPHSDSNGRKMWEQEVANKRFIYSDGNPMITFQKFMEKYNSVAKSVDKLNSTSEQGIKISEINQKINDINVIISHIIDFRSQAIDKCKTNTLNCISSGNISKNDYSFVVCSVSNIKESIFEDDKYIHEKLGGIASSLLILLQRQSGFSSKLEVNTIYEKVGEVASSKSVALNNELFDKFEKHNIVIDRSANYKRCYYFMDNGLMESLKAEKDKLEQELKKLEEELSDLISRKTNEALGFNPTVENFVKMVLAHLEVLLRMIYQCADSADNDSSRTKASLGIQVTDTNREQIPAFPKVGVYNETSKKYEDGWLGDLAPNAVEVNLINGLLNGISPLIETINNAVGDIDKTSNKNSFNSNLVMPITSYDFNSTESVFGGSSEFYENEALTRLGIRMFTALSTNFSSNAAMPKLFGIGDAYNFYKQYPSPTESFREAVINGVYQKKKLDEILNPKINGKNYLKEEPLFLVQDSIYLNGKNGTLILSSKEGNSFILPSQNTNFDGNQTNDEIIPYNVPSSENKNVFNIIENIGEIDNYSEAINHIDLGNEEQSEMLRKLYRFNDDVDAMMSEYYGNREELSKSLCLIKSLNRDKHWWESLFNMNNYTNEYTLFGVAEYYNLISKELKAFVFLNSILDEFKTEQALSFIKSSNGYFKLLPKPFVLILGGNLWYNKYCRDNKIERVKTDLQNSVEALRDEFKNALEKYFLKWCEEDFTEIQKNCELSGQAVLDISKATDENTVNGLLKSYLQNGTYNECKVTTCGKNFKIRLPLIEDGAGHSLIMKLMSTKVLLHKGAIVAKVKNQVPFMMPSRCKAYIDGFFGKLKELYEKGKEEKKIEGTAKNPDIDKMAKISLYNYIKMVYDRWLCGKQSKNRSMWYFDKMLERFHFIDSYYFKIGDDCTLNVKFIAELIEKSLRQQNNISLVSFLYEVLRDNDFLFLSVQNFVDLSRSDLFNEMFKPLPYNEIGVVNPQTDFVCIYTYKKSSNLDMQGANYTNDSFMLGGDVKENELLPIMANRTVDNSYKLPCFGVTYGKQYQSYFTNISPSMESSVSTEQAMKAKFMIADLAGEPNNKALYVGQDLFTIYSNNSYDCTVEMMGCAWIQPLMYFQLNNLPLFRGSYLIQKVKHVITPGNMKTTFVGSRMCRIANPLTKDALYYPSNDSFGGADRLGYETNTDSPTIDRDCVYAKYDPLSEIPYKGGNARGVEFYKRLKLKDFNIPHPNVGDASMYNAICAIVNNEASGEGDLGKELVTVVLLHRIMSSTKGYSDVFNNTQFSGFSNLTLANQSDPIVDKVLNEGANFLIGQIAKPIDAVECYSHGRHIGKAENKEITYDDLSKIYMFNNTACYSSVSPDSTANPIKKTQYAFQHGKHVFHYGPNVDSNKSFWELGQAKADEIMTNNNEEKELLNVSKFSLGLYKAIQKSAKISPSVGVDVSLVKGSIKDTSFMIQSDNKEKFGKVFDMILNTYYRYCGQIEWFMDTPNETFLDSPKYIRITPSDENPNVCQVYMSSRDGSVFLGGKDSDEDKALRISPVFCKALSAKYNDENEFVSDCKKSCDREFYSFLKRKYEVCLEEPTSDIVSLDTTAHMGAVEGLPDKVAYPIKGVNHPMIINAGFFNEPRGARKHLGIDLSYGSGTKISCDNGVDICALLDGKVISVSPTQSVGDSIVIKYNVGNEKGTMYTRYLHGCATVSPNTVVKAGQVVGKIGGQASYARHLHMEMSFFKGDYTFKKFKDNLVDPQSYYYFGNFYGSVNGKRMNFSQYKEVDKFGYRLDLAAIPLQNIHPC